MLLALAISTVGCSNKNIKERPSDEELAKATTLCGVVREVSDDTLRIQLCGNSFWSNKGATYINVTDDYKTFAENDSVLLYYTGNMRSEEKDEYVEVYNIEVSYIEPYENDGKFTANMTLDGGCVPEGATQINNTRYLVPVEGEPEGDFQVVLDVTDLITNQVTEMDIVYDVEDIWAEVTVTYDIDTMEVISIIQSK